MDERLRNRLVKNLRSDFLVKIPELPMSEERKSYLTHQLLNSHQIEDLISLVDEINKKQQSEGRDLIFPNLMGILQPNFESSGAPHQQNLFWPF